MIQQFSKPERFWNLIDSGLLFALFAGLFIGFLVTLGFVAMSARIVTKGKCSLSIWLVGVRRYFWRILNVSIMLGILGAFTAVVIELLLPVSLYHIPESAFTLALLTCYAAIMIDDASVESSISLGLKTVRESGRVFVIFCLIHAVIHLSRVLFEGNLWSTYPIEPMSINVSSVSYTVAVSFLSPLWYLIMFSVYRKFSPMVKKTN